MAAPASQTSVGAQVSGSGAAIHRLEDSHCFSGGSRFTYTPPDVLTAPSRLAPNLRPGTTSLKLMLEFSKLKLWEDGGERRRCAGHAALLTSRPC